MCSRPSSRPISVAADVAATAHAVDEVLSTAPTGLIVPSSQGDTSIYSVLVFNSLVAVSPIPESVHLTRIFSHSPSSPLTVFVPHSAFFSHHFAF
ncbi:hypothetical protein L596_012479 [Steinernema carpocapsae]|uniref:Uncharacterized protein n=1 Tax=Steinernema carpocapsae TaxID=34508 RepID=A0A4U5NXA8_STECR|nr:hypothetical protein L596_012479 [Steinernema carpocapsae]